MRKKYNELTDSDQASMIQEYQENYYQKNTVEDIDQVFKDINPTVAIEDGKYNCWEAQRVLFEKQLFKLSSKKSHISNPSINYFSVIPNSHSFSDLDMIIRYVEGMPKTKETEYFLIGLKNTKKDGYLLSNAKLEVEKYEAIHKEMKDLLKRYGI